jgi:hypothetical protein
MYFITNLFLTRASKYKQLGRKKAWEKVEVVEQI